MARRTTDKIFNGKLARNLRKDKEPGITIDELAEKITQIAGRRWHRDTLTNVELGHTQPGLKLSHAWAQALDVPRSELLMDAPEDVTP